MQVKVLFFATLKELAGRKEFTVELPVGASVAELKARLGQALPEVAPAMDTVVVAINREFSFDEEPVPFEAEVALFPPVSGGGGELPPTVLAITEAPLDLDALLAQITLPTTGAACLFTGMVRGVTRAAPVMETEYLEYEAYQPMAEAKLRQVAEEMRARWPVLEGIAIVQRVGRLPVGTPTVVVGCTAAHRGTGVFEAARYGIDRLKEIVPVWKKEVGPQGQAWIEGAYRPQALKDTAGSHGS